MNCTQLLFHSNSKQKAADKFSEVSFNAPIISTRCGSFSSPVSSYCNKLSENWSHLSFLQPSKHNPKIGIPAFPHPSDVSWDFGISKAIKYDYIFSAIRPPVRRIGQLRAFIIHFKWLPKFSLGWCRFIAESLDVSVFLGIYIAGGVGALRVKPLPTPETGNGSSMGPSVASSKALGSDFERLVGTGAARSARKKSAPSEKCRCFMQTI